MIDKYKKIPELIRSGDSYELSLILDDLRAYLIGFLLGNYYTCIEDAEDIAQYTLMQLTNECMRDRVSDSVIALCVTIARNEYFTQYNQRRIKPLKQGVSIEIIKGFHPKSNNKTDDEIIENQTRKLIMDAGKKLPESQRDILNLILNVPGITDREMASILGLNEVTQKTAKHRMRRKISKYLDSHAT